MSRVMKTKIAFFVLFILSNVTSFALPYEIPEQTEQDLIFLNKKVLRDYPRLMQTHRDPKNFANIFWYNNVNCLNQATKCEKLIDQTSIHQIQNTIIAEVIPRLEKFDTLAFKYVSNWNEIRKEVFPVSYYIDLDKSIIWSYSTYTNGKKVPLYLASGDLYGTIEEKSRISIGQIDAVPQAIPTIALHEFGHILLRALSFPQIKTAIGTTIDSPMEEALADLISIIANDNTPYIGPGTKESVSKAIEQALTPTSTQSNQITKLKLESKLWGATDKAIRDFSRSYSLQDAYILPENENLSLTFNSYLYKVMNIVGTEMIHELILTSLSDNLNAFMNGDLTLIIKEILALYKKSHPIEYKNKIKSILELSIQLGWTKPVENNSISDVNFSISNDSNLVEIKVHTHLQSGLLYDPKTTPLVITLTDNKKAHFAFLDFSRTITNQGFILKPLFSCEKKSPLCICNEDKNTLHIEILFLNSYRQVEKIISMPIPKELIQFSECYLLQIERI